MTFYRVMKYEYDLDPDSNRISEVKYEDFFADYNEAKEVFDAIKETIVITGDIRKVITDCIADWQKWHPERNDFVLTDESQLSSDDLDAHGHVKGWDCALFDSDKAYGYINNYGCGYVVFLDTLTV